MSDNGHDDPKKGEEKSEAGGAIGSSRAQQLFGHKGGAKPWDNPAPANPAGAPDPDQAKEVSAPYPKDSKYAPRPPAETAPTSSIFSEVDDDGELTRLHPNYKLLMRVAAVFVGLGVMFGAFVLEGILQSQDIGWPFGFFIGPAVIVALIIIIRVPMARYNARGYQISRDRLRVVRGILWRADTIVPFGRVQHIDVDQGPIDRALGLATMTLHTAGSHNASVRLPGLGHELAIEMREAIRAHIKRETL